MKYSIRLSAVAAAVIVAYSSLRLSAATIPASFSLSLTSKGETADTALYDIRATIFDSFFDTFTDPTGHVFSNFSPSVSGLTQSSALAELIGQWTISAKRFSSSVPEIYSFTVAAFTPADMFTIPPTIVSPSDGSTVSTHFTVNFAWPPGNAPTPTARASSSSWSSSIATETTTVSAGSNVYPVSVTFKPGETQGQFTIAVGTFQFMNQYVSAVSTTEMNPSLSWSGGLTYYDLSAPVTLTVTSVPEPGALMPFSVIAASIVTGQCRRRLVT